MEHKKAYSFPETQKFKLLTADVELFPDTIFQTMKLA